MVHICSFNVMRCPQQNCFPHLQSMCGVPPTLGPIMDFQVSWKSGTFQLAHQIKWYIYVLSMLCGVPTQIIPPIYKVWAVSNIHLFFCSLGLRKIIKTIMGTQLIPMKMFMTNCEVFFNKLLSICSQIGWNAVLVPEGGQIGHFHVTTR